MDIMLFEEFVNEVKYTYEEIENVLTSFDGSPFLFLDLDNDVYLEALGFPSKIEEIEPIEKNGFKGIFKYYAEIKKVSIKPSFYSELHAEFKKIRNSGPGELQADLKNLGFDAEKSATFDEIKKAIEKKAPKNYTWVDIDQRDFEVDMLINDYISPTGYDDPNRRTAEISFKLVKFKGSIGFAPDDFSDEILTELFN